MIIINYKAPILVDVRVDYYCVGNGSASAIWVGAEIPVVSWRSISSQRVDGADRVTKASVN